MDIIQSVLLCGHNSLCFIVWTQFTLFYCVDTIHSVLLFRHNSHSRASKKNVVCQTPGDCDIVAQGCRVGCKPRENTQPSSWPLPHHINEQRREGKQLCVYRQMMGTYYTLQQDFSALICHRNFKYL